MPPITIFWSGELGCKMIALVPETCPPKLISPAVKVRGLLPAAKLELKAMVAFPRENVTGAFKVTGLLKVMF